MPNKKPSELSVYSKVSIEKSLIDRRRETRGIKFGKVRDVARQFGVKIDESDDFAGFLRFTAPKSRLQMFVEKLHFSGISYWE